MHFIHFQHVFLNFIVNNNVCFFFFFFFFFTFVRDDMHTKLQRKIEEITKSHFLQFNILFLSHLLIAGCDIGVQISVRPYVRSSVRSFVRSSVNIYVEV